MAEDRAVRQALQLAADAVSAYVDDPHEGDATGEYRQAEAFLRAHDPLAVAKFWSRVEIPQHAGWERRCWLWKGAKTTDGRKDPGTGGWGGGYGCLKVKGVWVRAHVHIWTLYHGPVPEGLIIGHACDVRHCVNVFHHLGPVTPGDNLREAYERGRREVPF